MKNAINNQVGMLGDMFLWLLANLKQGVIYFKNRGARIIKLHECIISYLLLIKLSHSKYLLNSSKAGLIEVESL